MRFKRFRIRPTKIARTVRRVKNAERAIQKEREQVKQIGNSVPVRTAKAIVKAIFGKAV